MVPDDALRHLVASSGPATSSTRRSWRPSTASLDKQIASVVAARGRSRWSLILESQDGEVPVACSRCGCCNEGFEVLRVGRPVTTGLEGQMTARTRRIWSWSGCGPRRIPRLQTFELLQETAAGRGRSAAFPIVLRIRALRPAVLKIRALCARAWTISWPRATDMEEIVARIESVVIRARRSGPRAGCARPGVGSRATSRTSAFPTSSRRWRSE